MKEAHLTNRIKMVSIVVRIIPSHHNLETYRGNRMEIARKWDESYEGSVNIVYLGSYGSHWATALVSMRALVNANDPWLGHPTNLRNQPLVRSGSTP